MSREPIHPQATSRPTSWPSSNPYLDPPLSSLAPGSLKPGAKSGQAEAARRGGENGAEGESSSVSRWPGESSADPAVSWRARPQWWLLNFVLPTLLLGGAAGLVWLLGTVESVARPPLVDTAAGRMFALPPVDVKAVRSLASTDEKLQLGADGTVVPYREVTLATEVAGRVIEKSPLCEAGKYVTEGHVLMKIDPTDYQLEVKRLQRLQQQEYEAIGELDQETVNIGRSMELARADIELLQREVKRRESLPDQFASQGELDQARRAVLTAEQQFVLYQNQLDLARKRRTRLESSERLAAIQLEAAENNLKRTSITAPIDGVIVSEQAELNTFVSRGSPVVTMEDTSKVEVATQLRTDQLYWVLNQKTPATQSGDGIADPQEEGAGDVRDEATDRGYRLPPTPVTVRYDLTGREGMAYQWRGRLVGYNGIGLDEQTRTVPVRIVVDDPRAVEVIRDGEVVRTDAERLEIVGPTTLVRGMFVSLRLELEPAVDLVILPGEALKPGNRVWMFTPDASVLEKSLASAVEPTGSEISARTPGDQRASDEVDGDTSRDDPLAMFDASAWVAGNLQVLSGVRPVDEFFTTKQATPSTALPVTFSAAVPASVSDRDGEAARYWICEVPGATIGNGSYVVVSPLGSLRASVLPVRAPADGIETGDRVNSGVANR